MTAAETPFNSKRFYRHFIPCHQTSRQTFSRIFLIVILAIFQIFHNPVVSSEPVFIATRNRSTSASTQKTDGSANRKTTATLLRSFDVSTAKDAALALNSVQFMEMLVGTKNSADVNTYMQKHSTPKDNTSPSTKSQMEASDPAPTSTWNLVSSILGRRNRIHVDAESIPSAFHVHGGGNLHDFVDSPLTSTSSKPIEKSCPEHVTVSEYVGRLWFLSDNQGGIKFRETVRVISVADDGNSSAVECNTQYHNGSKWVDCSKIICRFSSIPSISGGGDETSLSGKELSPRGGEGEGMKVSMNLDCELLVWLPLPKAATKAVTKKISSVFENVAINFFEELATN